MTAVPPIVVEVTRDGRVESAHRGHVVVAASDGRVVTARGDAGAVVFGRSALKPFQAVAVLHLLAEQGRGLDEVGTAIACASHVGGDDHQIEAARLLAEAGLDEAALRCPPALPTHVPTLLAQRTPTSLAHNCSGKHAAMLLAHVGNGGHPAGYLHLNAPVQATVPEVLRDALATPPEGPGVDGCGAPAWLVPLRGLATGFARLAGAAEGPLAQVRQAMTARPDLVGGGDTPDTLLMRDDLRVVAKRGAEGVFAAGYLHERAGAVGVAVKVEDGAARAAGAAAAAVVEAFGAVVPTELRRQPVLGGVERHGEIRAVPDLALAVTEALGLS